MVRRVKCGRNRRLRWLNLASRDLQRGHPYNARRRDPCVESTRYRSRHRRPRSVPYLPERDLGCSLGAASRLLWRSPRCTAHCQPKVDSFNLSLCLSWCVVGDESGLAERNRPAPTSRRCYPCRGGRSRHVARASHGGAWRHADRCHYDRRNAGDSTHCLSHAPTDISSDPDPRADIGAGQRVGDASEYPNASRRGADSPG